MSWQCTEGLQRLVAADQATEVYALQQAASSPDPAAHLQHAGRDVVVCWL